MALFMQDYDIDVAFLSELHLVRSQTRRRRVHDSLLAFWASREEARSANDGCVMLIHRSWGKYIHKIHKWKGRMVALELTFPSQRRLFICGVYVPSDRHGGERSDYVRLLREVRRHLRKWKKEGGEVLVMGDFNAALSPVIDRLYLPPAVYPRSRIDAPESSFLRMLLAEGLTDAYRLLYPSRYDEMAMSRADPGRPGHFSRIDGIFLSHSLTSPLTEVGHHEVRHLATDHKLVFAELAFGRLWGITPVSPEATKLGRREVWLFKDMTEEKWGEFSKEVEWILLSQHSLDLEERSVDQLWDELSQSMLRAASRLIPVKRIGGDCGRGDKCGYRTCAIRLLIGLLRTIKVEGPLVQASEDLRNRWRKVRVAMGKIKGCTGKELLPAMQWQFEAGDWDAWSTAASGLVKLLQLDRKNALRQTATERVRLCVERRCELQKANQGEMIRRILERGGGSVQLDHILVREGGAVRLVDDPEEIKIRTREHFYQWTVAQPVHKEPPILNAFWESVYAPSEEVRAEWWDELMDPPSKEELDAALNQAPLGKAAGPSRVTNEMLRALGPHGKEWLLTLCGRVFTSSTAPSEWKHGLLYPIPKTENWNGDLDAVRPITLLEHARKVCLKMLTDRVTRICAAHPILNPNNSSVLVGTSIQEPLHIMNAIFEHAREHREELWVVLQDMRRAFDSVPWHMLERSCRRLKIPDGYITLYQSLRDGKTKQVLTPYGPTASFVAEIGEDQGDVSAPLHWRIAYDPLLVAIERLGLGFRGKEKVLRSLVPRRVEVLEAQQSSIVYVDDSAWVSSSKKRMGKILKTVSAFMALYGIRVNGAKTHLLVLNPSGDPRFDPLCFGNPPVPLVPLAPAAATRYLGSMLSADGKMAAQRQQIVSMIADTVALLRPKMITDSQTVYIINKVLVPRILARCTLFTPSRSECERWWAPVRCLLKEKARLPRDTPTSIVYNPQLYGLLDLYDAVCEHHIAELRVRLESLSESSAGKWCRLRLHSLQRRLGYVSSPLSAPPHELVRHGVNLIGRVMPMLAERRVTFRELQHEPLRPGGVPLHEVLPPELFRRCRASLVRYELFFVEQFLNPACSQLLPWETVRKHSHQAPRREPIWFPDLASALSVPGMLASPRAVSIAIKPRLPEHNPLLPRVITFTKLDFKVDDWVVVFPEGFEKRKVFWVARIVKWDAGKRGGPLRYLLEHWRDAREEDDASGWLERHDAYVRCRRDCGGADATTARQWPDCCRWWEEQGFVAISHLARISRYRSYDFRGRDVHDPIPFLLLDWCEGDLLAAFQSLTLQDPRQQERTVSHGAGNARTNESEICTGLQLGSLVLQEAGRSVEALKRMAALEGWDSTVVYTDGSVLNTGSEHIAGGAGIAVYTKGEGRSCQQLSFSVGGFLSSTKAEIWAALIAIATLPSHVSIELFSDSQAFLAGFERWVANKHSSRRARLRTNFVMEWTLFRSVMDTRRASTKLRKVQAHVGIVGNEEADRLAKAGAGLGAEGQLVVDMARSQVEVRFMPMLGGVDVEGDLKRTIRMLTCARIGVQWRRQNRVRRLELPEDAVDWRATLKNLHSGAPPTSLITSLALNARRQYRVKLLHGMLPVKTRLHEVRPDLYENDLCPRCGDESEDQAHLWTCRVAQDGLTQAVGRVEEFVREETTKRGAQARLSSATIRRVFFSSLACRGVVLKSWREVLSNAGVPCQFARELGGRIGAQVVDELQSLVWKARCEQQVKVERERGITWGKKSRRRHAHRLCSAEDNGQQVGVGEGVFAERSARLSRENRCLWCGSSAHSVKGCEDSVEALAETLLLQHLRGTAGLPPMMAKHYYIATTDTREEECRSRETGGVGVEEVVERDRVRSPVEGWDFAV